MFVGVIYGVTVVEMARRGINDTMDSDVDKYDKAENYAKNAVILLCGAADVVVGGKALLSDKGFLKQALSTIGDSIIDVAKLDKNDFAVIGATNISEAMAGIKGFLTEDVAAYLERLLTGQPMDRIKRFLLSLKQSLWDRPTGHYKKLDTDDIKSLWKGTEEEQSASRAKKILDILDRAKELLGEGEAYREFEKLCEEEEKLKDADTVLDAFQLMKESGEEVAQEAVEKSFKLAEEGLSAEEIVGRVLNKGGSRYAKATLRERVKIKSTNINNLHPNPLDEFSDPKIGPSDSTVSRYIKEISTKGTISEPIVVQKLVDGGYEIVNGHHKWLAAVKTGLEDVPIKIVNYENYIRMERL